MAFYLLTLCIIVTPKCVLWQTVRTQIKCRIMQEYIRNDKVLHYSLRQQLYPENNYNFYLEIITCDPSIYTTDHSMYIVSNRRMAENGFAPHPPPPRNFADISHLVENLKLRLLRDVALCALKRQSVCKSL